MSRARSWCFTVNNWTPAEEVKVMALITDEHADAVACGKEVGEGGTRHLQGVVYLKSRMRLAQVKRVPGLERAHLEVMRGTWEQAKTYALKDGDILISEGEGPQPGKRNDLKEAMEKMKGGMSLKELHYEEPAVVARYPKFFAQLDDFRSRDLERQPIMPKCIWIHGPPGVGKSHIVYEWSKTLSEKPFWYKEDRGWWDAYTGQEVVIINEFDGSIPYKELLVLCDKYPTSVRRRGREPMPWMALTVVITTNETMEATYPKQAAEPMGVSALERRFHIVEKLAKNDAITMDSIFQEMQ